MNKSRLEAFSDGVIAIIITIMVLELHVPQAAGWEALRPLLPVLLAYLLSFVNVGIYWNNHHHMLHLVKRVNGGILWANLHLLFWLSLFPFVTGWMGENHFAAIPTAVYGCVSAAAAVAYTLLQAVILRSEGPDALLGRAVGADFKGKLSLAAYLLAIPLAFRDARLSDALFVVVALMWLVPDRRIERVLQSESAGGRGAAL